MIEGIDSNYHLDDVIATVKLYISRFLHYTEVYGMTEDYWPVERYGHMVWVRYINNNHVIVTKSDSSLMFLGCVYSFRELAAGVTQYELRIKSPILHLIPEDVSP